MILLASNSRTVLLQLERLCLQHQLATCSATDLQQARRLMARNELDAMVIDDWFPDGRGADLLAEARGGSRHVPVIAIGSQAELEPGTAVPDDQKPDLKVSKSELLTRLPQELERLLSERRSNLGRVLVVDDSLTYRTQLRLSLEAAGYTVVLAETGEEGVRCAFENPPDAMLVDAMLPGISGPQVVRRIRAESSTRRTPCLLLTASEDAAQELEALEAGADTFVRKDEQIAVILARLAGVMRAASTPAATSLAALPQMPRRVALIGMAIGSLDSAGTVLLEEGCETIALTPEQATLDRFEALQPDVLLYEAPVEAEVLAFCQQFRGRATLRNSRLLLLDTVPGRTQAVAAIQAGADDYLPAGSDRSVILARVKSHLRRKRVEDENRGLREHILRAELETEAQRSLAEERTRHADEMRAAYGMAEQKAQEAERARLELEQITEGIPQIVWTSDADGRNASFNRRWTDYTGLPNRAGAVNVAGGLWRRAIHREDLIRALRHWVESYRGGLPYTSEYRLRSTAGEYRWFLVRAIPLTDEQGEIDRWFGTCTDIHDQKLSEEALRRTEKLAATGRLAASIAHEINNPLEAVTNLLYLIEGSVRKDEETHGYVTIAQKELDRVAQISKKTLAFYRESTQAGAVDLCGLVSEVVEIYSVRLERKGIHLQLEEDCDRKPSGLAGELRQVISNLVTNAIDASPDASTLRIRIRGAHRWDETGTEGVRISVADRGHGIPAALQSDIFKPFVTTKGQKGTGLGLWLSHSIMERHGGSMRLRSATGDRHGTCFSLFLPMEYQGAGREADSMGTMLRTIGKELLGQA